MAVFVKNTYSKPSIENCRPRIFAANDRPAEDDLIEPQVMQTHRFADDKRAEAMCDDRRWRVSWSHIPPILFFKPRDHGPPPEKKAEDRKPAIVERLVPKASLI